MMIETKRMILRPFRSGVHRIYAECDPRNEASRRLLEKAGFRQEALFRQYISFRKDAEGKPVWSDTCVYALLESDLSEIKGKEEPSEC